MSEKSRKIQSIGRASNRKQVSRTNRDLLFLLQSLKLLFKVQKLLHEKRPYADNQTLIDNYREFQIGINRIEQLISEIPRPDVSEFTIRASEDIKSLKEEASNWFNEQKTRG